MIQNICQWTASEDTHFKTFTLHMFAPMQKSSDRGFQSMWHLIRAKESGFLLKGLTELMTAKCVK